MKYVTFFCALLFSLSVFANCKVLNSSGIQVSGLSDVLFKILKLHEECPVNIVELKNLLGQDGLQVAP